MDKIKEIIEVLRNNDFFLVTSHLNPDGDAIGSQLALASLLEEMGKRAVIIDEDPVPDRFRFLSQSDRITVISSSLLRTEDFPQVSLVLDCSDLGRAGKVQRLVKETNLIVNIDHHISNDKFGDINLIDEEASAVGEQIFALIESLGYPVGKERAVSLYTAILTDTGSFQYVNTTPKTHQIAACLLREGINPSLIAEKLYRASSFSQQKLLGLALATLERSSDGSIAWFWLTRDMYRQSQSSSKDTDGFIDCIQSIEGVKLALSFREMEDNKVKVSFRSKGEIDAASLASHFGGGGHRGAAGCRIEGSIQEVEKRVLAVASQCI